MTIAPFLPPMVLPTTVEAALEALGRAGSDAASGALPLAGGTWLMRAPLRHEARAETYVSLSRVAGFDRLEIGVDRIAIGPLATHDRLARALPADPDLRALVQAAGASANPGVRRLATIGGNLCAVAFAASDFAPALLALDARVELRSAAGVEDLSVTEFMTRRSQHSQPWLLCAITVPRGGRLSAHVRLPMRRAGDYPCAIVSVSAVLGAGLIRDARIAVGAVEAAARRWPGLEAAVEGQALRPEEIEALARARLADFAPRDAVDAPGWYRTAVLPALVRRAFDSLLAQRGTR
ncbi:MAG: xanthine dehydrogenase family protein subunit M [Pseudodonghicola sp.]